MSGKSNFPVCHTHTDCFANKDGHCVCLSDNDFGHKDCPFYKKDSGNDWEKIMTACTTYGLTHSVKEKENLNG